MKGWLLIETLLVLALANTIVWFMVRFVVAVALFLPAVAAASSMRPS